MELELNNKFKGTYVVILYVIIEIFFAGGTEILSFLDLFNFILLKVIYVLLYSNGVFNIIFNYISFKRILITE